VVGSRTLFARQKALDAGACIEPEAKSPGAGVEVMRSIYGSGRFPGKVALTFDDGPNARITLEVLDVLKAHGATATFLC
jgi:peptidoglycan/xylan/chitin deacetylase (PgdA/CDA1 family)